MFTEETTDQTTQTKPLRARATRYFGINQRLRRKDP